MSTKVAGTFYVDGLLQGRAPEDEIFNGSIQSWVEAARNNGLAFSFTREGGNFTLLPGDNIQKSSRFGALSVQDALRDAFQQFLEFFPVQDRMHLLSTLRSVEYRPNAEVQTIYAVVPPGKIEIQERTIDAKTVDPEPELTKEGKIKLGLIALGCALLFALLLFFLAKTFFPEWLAEKQDQMTFADADKIEIDAKNLEGYIIFNKGEIDRLKGGMFATLERGPQWQSAIESPGPGDSGWDEFLAIQAIKRGYIRVEMYGMKEDLLLSDDFNISGLKEEKEIRVFLSMKTKMKVHRIRLTY